MNLRNFFLNTFHHRLPRAMDRVRQVFAAPPEARDELARDSDRALRALSQWAKENPIDDLQRGRDPERGIKYLRKMEDNDAHYAGVLESRKMGLLSHDWDIMPGSDDPKDIEIADFVKWCFRTVDWTMIEILRAVLDAIGIGFSIAEKVWEQVIGGDYDGLWRLKAIKDKDQTAIKFNVDGFGNITENGIHYSSGYAATLKLSPAKFLIYTFDKKRGNIYGNGAGIVCSWYSWFKRDGIKFWLGFLQKFGNPTAKGKVPATAKPSDRDQFEDIIESLSDRTGIVLPPGFEIELMEATRRGEAGYMALLDYCDAQMSKKILGGTLTAEPGPTGAYALGKVHAEVREEVIKFDAISLADTINEQVIKPLVDYNFQDVTNYPRLEFLFDEPIDRRTVAESLVKAQEAGLAVPSEWAYQELQIPPPVEGEKTLVPPPKGGGMFAEAEEFAEAPKEVGPTERIQLRRKLLPREEKFADIPGVATELERVFTGALGQARDETTKIRDDILVQVKKKLVVGGRLKKSLRQNPVVINVSGLRKAMVNQAMISWLWGQLHATNELQRMGFYFPQRRLDKFQEGPEIPIPAEAVKFFRNKIPITKKQFLQKLESERDRYFTVAGLAKNDIEKTIQPMILNAIEHGTTFDEFKFLVSEEMVKYTGDVYSGTPWMKPAGAPMAEYHLATIFRTNLMSAYNAGRTEIYRDPDVAGFVTHLQFSAVMDERTSDYCEPYDGRVYLVDDPIWDDLEPPRHHNCRSVLVPVSAKVEEGIKADSHIKIGPRGF